MKYHRVSNLSTISFLFLSVVLYVGFTLCDIFDYQYPLSNHLKFMAIVLCLIICLVYRFSYPANTDAHIMPYIFIFTVIADIFLLFTQEFIYGVISFCIVQLLHLYRIHKITKVSKYHLPLRVILSIVILFCLSRTSVSVDALLCVTVFYFINFCANIALLVYMTIKKITSSEIKVTMYLVGMILFILCDVSVGVFNLTSYITIHSQAFVVIKTIAAFGMWGFYLPGQMLIALSTKKK